MRLLTRSRAAPVEVPATAPAPAPATKPTPAPSKPDGPIEPRYPELIRAAKIVRAWGLAHKDYGQPGGPRCIAGAILEASGSDALEPTPEHQSETYWRLVNAVRDNAPPVTTISHGVLGVYHARQGTLEDWNDALTENVKDSTKVAADLLERTAWGL